MDATRRHRTRAATAPFAEVLTVLLCLAWGGPAAADPPLPVLPAAGGRAASVGYSAGVTLETFTAGAADGTGYLCSAGFQASLGTGSAAVFLPRAAGPAGQELVVRAEFAAWDDSWAVTLHYRPGGGAGFLTAACERSAGEVAAVEARIPAEAVTSRGVQYYFGVRAGNAAWTAPAGAPIQLAGAHVRVEDQSILTTEAGRYGLYGTPLLADAPDPGDLFAELGPHDPYWWRLGAWDAAAGEYRTGPDAGPCTPGRGFWLVTRQDREIRASGTSTPLDRAVVLELEPGFHQIANPFDFPLSWSAVRAFSRIEPFLYGWNGTSYDPESHTRLEAARGYWVCAPAGGGRLVLSPAAAEKAAQPAARATGDEAPWSLRATVRVGDEARAVAILSWAGALAAADAAGDVPAPPPAPATRLDLFAVAADGTRLLKDLAAGAHGATWDLALDSQWAGSWHELAFEASGSLPADWGVVAIDERDGRRLDPLSGEPWPVRSESGPVRRWRILAGPAGYLASELGAAQQERAEAVTTVSLQAPYPNPCGGGQSATVAFSLPQDGPVELDVYDLRGRRVRSVLDESLPRGVHRASWDGRDRGGRRCAAGIYFLRLETSQTRLIRKLVLVR